MEMVKTEGIPPREAFEQDLVGLSEGTQRLYRRWLDNFLKYVNGTPEELVEMINNAENRPLALKSLRKTIEKYQDELVNEYCTLFEKCEDSKDGCFEGCEKRKGLNPNTVTVVSKAISKFLQSNEINDFKMKRKQTQVESKGKRVLLKEQVTTLYEDAGKSRRLRAIVMTLKDCGLRVSDLVKLTIEDFNNARRIQTDSGEFRVWAEPLTTTKNGVNAHVHLGPESVEALKDYIGNRTAGAIFLTERSMPTKNGYTRPGQPMKGNNVTTCMRTLCKHLKSQGFNVSGHSLRKYFFTNLATKIELSYVKVLAGKKLPPTDAPYLQAAYTGKLTQLYIDNYEILRIHTHKNVDAEVEQLRAELATMREMLSERSHSPEDQQITIEDIRRYRRIQQLEAEYPDTDKGFAQLTKALNKLEE